MAKKKSRKRKALDADLPIYQVKISLDVVTPAIWRRVHTDDCSLADLHDVIQDVMGWEEVHPYAFVVEGEEIGDLRWGGDFEYDSRHVRLSQLVENEVTRFRYDYDFGDDWQHTIDVEQTLPAEQGVCYPRCVAGERAGPPEDCGGPYRYADFVDAYQDPEHEEHEEVREWLGDDFDPEPFDLDRVNRELRDLRRWLGRRKGKHARRAAFAKGSLACVKQGVVHERYPDLPLGGWVGRVKRIGWLTPIGYAVHWTQPTLDRAHAVFFKRCRRDDLKPHRYWLDEDQLEAAADETPVAMEQPERIITRPLATDDPDDRVRMVFGLTSDDELPAADEPAQRHFLDYLKGHLTFPFAAEYAPACVLSASKSEMATVLGFAEPPLDRKDGIVCVARQGENEFHAPLSNLRIGKDDANYRHVEDYTYWLWEACDPEAP